MGKKETRLYKPGEYTYRDNYEYKWVECPNCELEYDAVGLMGDVGTPVECKCGWELRLLLEVDGDESKRYRDLRNWLKKQRDNATKKYHERNEEDDMMFGQQLAYKKVLEKLREMGCGLD